MILSFLKQYYKSIIIGIMILWLSLSENDAINPGNIFNIPNADKAGHFVAYMFFSAVLMLDSGRWQRTMRFKYQLLIIPVLLGALMELFQRLLTQMRQADWVDMIADLVGIFFGLMIAIAAKKLLRSDS